MTTAASLIASPALCFRYAFGLLIEAAKTRIRHCTQTEQMAEDAKLLKAQRATDRANRAMEWVLSLARVLAADKLYRRPWRFPRFKPMKGGPSFSSLGLPSLASLGLAAARPAPTDVSRALARLNYMRRVFDTQPTGVIAARIARSLGIKKTSDYWPKDLIAITVTPVQWSKDNPPPPDLEPNPPFNPGGATPSPAAQPQPPSAPASPTTRASSTQASEPDPPPTPKIKNPA